MSDCAGCKVFERYVAALEKQLEQANERTTAAIEALGVRTDQQLDRLLSVLNPSALAVLRGDAPASSARQMQQLTDRDGDPVDWIDESGMGHVMVPGDGLRPKTEALRAKRQLEAMLSNG